MGTLQQLKRLTPQQLLHAASHYRPEVGEKGLPKSAVKYLMAVQKEAALKRDRRRSRAASPAPGAEQAAGPSDDGPEAAGGAGAASPGRANGGGDGPEADGEDAPEHLLLDPALMLPFTLPSVTDMLVSYGAGFGGVNRERELKYIPTVPAEFLEKLEVSGVRREPMFADKDWENEEV